MENTKNIRAVLIFEIIGKPAEHLVKNLEEIIKNIDNEKSVSVKTKNIKKPTEIEEKPGFFTTFAEIEIETEEILYLAVLMFKYMPAHIEIVSPELIALTNNGWTDILSELARRMHGYDEIARVLQMEKSILEKKLKQVLGTKEKKQPRKASKKSKKK